MAGLLPMAICGGNKWLSVGFFGNGMTHLTSIGRGIFHPPKGAVEPCVDRNLTRRVFPSSRPKVPERARARFTAAQLTAADEVSHPDSG
jgi:hypothetical protein